MNSIIFMVTFDQFNASLLSKSINALKNTQMFERKCA